MIGFGQDYPYIWIIPIGYGVTNYFNNRALHDPDFDIFTESSFSVTIWVTLSTDILVHVGSIAIFISQSQLPFYKYFGLFIFD